MPSRFHSDRLKALCTEGGWSQADLAERIDSDVRQASRYENNKVAPGLEAVIRIALTFNVSVDDLLIDDERATVTNVIDALVTKSKLRAITSGVG
ncbi:helix-turn-helix transcriptional regulator [Actinopolymorpha pittospori]|uniref:Transcriptional regulator with XRE-family HTH domain n=1 Tax=Actinopolymorpha pittospori TaxID=648752 RepID=A0A927MYE2_9ACTN|nr:helix-turn-helix transcriptional regulator [Actinopolymorpha pittospori]MBE1608609.1 transcriptional regulator with XRE-family HTH domain [Actinopolymorpha pittospori]